MAGIRIHHRSDVSVFKLIPSKGRFVTRPQGKGKPMTVEPKVHRIQLDSFGDGIVSPEVWGDIVRSGWGNQYLVMGEVANPPTQGVGMARAARNHEMVDSEGRRTWAKTTLVQYSTKINQNVRSA